MCGEIVRKKGVQVKTSKIINVRGTICDKFGNNTNDAAMQYAKISNIIRSKYLA